MTGTALGANSGKSTRTITFKNEAHKKFYMEYLQKCRYQDVYHRALVYCLGIDRDTRDHVKQIPGCVSQGIGILSRIKFRHKRSCGQNL